MPLNDENSEYHAKMVLLDFLRSCREFSCKEPTLPFDLIVDTELRTVYPRPDCFHHHINYPILPPANFIKSVMMRDLRMSTVGKRNRKASLSIRSVLTLPAELVLEILQWLHPVDLYNLVRTTKTLRALLLGRLSRLLWSRVFQNAPEIPSCPEGFSYPRWSTFVFGPPICDDCGINYALPNFSIYKHVCTRCMEYLFVSETYLDEWILDNEPDAHQGMVETCARAISPEHIGLDWSDLGKCYLRSELLEICSILRWSNDDTARETYILKRKQQLKIVERHSEECTTWASGLINNLENKSAEHLDSCAQAWARRLVKRGHDIRDVEDHVVRYTVDLPSFAKFTSKRFYKFLPAFEAQINRHKEKRLFEERLELIGNRKKSVDNILRKYPEYSNRLLSCEYLPPSFIAASYGIFFDYIHNLSSTIGVIPTDIGIKALGKLITDWENDCRRRLVLAVGEQYYGQTLHIPNSEILTRSNLLNIELAVMVFYCVPTSAASVQPNSNDPQHPSPLLSLSPPPRYNHHPYVRSYSGRSRPIFGFPEARMFMPKLFRDVLRDQSGTAPFTFPVPQNSPFKHGDVEFFVHDQGYRVVKMLLKLLDLDENITMRSDLDHTNARFACLSCCTQIGRGRRAAEAAKALDWKECVKHEVGNHHDDLELSDWALFSPDAQKHILLAEDHFPSHTDRVWYCRLCTQTFHRPFAQCDLFMHLRSNHNISSLGATEREVGWVQDRNKNHREPYEMDLSRKYRCLHCVGPNSVKLWRKDEWTTHWFANHVHVSRDPPGAWQEIELIEKVVSLRGSVISAL